MSCKICARLAWLIWCAGIVLPGHTVVGGDEYTAVATPEHWQDNALAKKEMNEMIAKLAAGDLAAALKRVVLTTESNATTAWVKSRFENWSADLQAGCYSSQAWCVKANGNWGIAFFVHLKGDLNANQGAAQRFATPDKNVNHWGMACYRFQEGWKLVPPGTGKDLPGYSGFVRDFQQCASPLDEIVKKEYSENSVQSK